MAKYPLNFTRAIFREAIFGSTADFHAAHFGNTVDFSEAKFKGTSNFRLAQFSNEATFIQAYFDSLAEFDFAHFDSSANFYKAIFGSTAGFNGVFFDSMAWFTDATFSNTTHFETVDFHQFADFQHATFDRQVYFRGTHFGNEAYFWGSHFDGMADFTDAQFGNVATFQSYFDSTVDFSKAIFSTRAYFLGAQFHNQATFTQAHFGSMAVFMLAHFDSVVDFSRVTFDTLADFSDARFGRHVSFDSSRFFGLATFVGATVDSFAEVDFARAVLGNVIEIGSEKSGSVRRYDVMRASFLEQGVFLDNLRTTSQNPYASIKSINTINYPGAKILIHGPVDLKIQLEKFRYLELSKTLDYYSKKDIITTLKEVSFNGDSYKQERYELDYIFQKSTMYQKQSTSFELYTWWQPITWWRWTYEATMGLGFRPFRLAWWGLCFIAVFAALYLTLMPAEVNRYLTKKEATYRRKIAFDFDSLLNCIYFSAMLFVTFRMKSDLLSSFNSRQKKLIVAEWLLGFLSYVAFLTLSEAGSILQTLKSLFVG